MSSLSPCDRCIYQFSPSRAHAGYQLDNLIFMTLKRAWKENEQKGKEDRSENGAVSSIK